MAIQERGVSCSVSSAIHSSSFGGFYPLSHPWYLPGHAQRLRLLPPELEREGRAVGHRPPCPGHQVRRDGLAADDRVAPVVQADPLTQELRADPVAGAGDRVDDHRVLPLCPHRPHLPEGRPKPPGRPPGRPPPGTAMAPAPRLPGQGWPPRWASTSRGKALRALRARRTEPSGCLHAPRPSTWLPQRCRRARPPAPSAPPARAPLSPAI